ncbi:MAG: dicarboxylate/amino acid:cation symporter [Flavobacteriales bacterium]|nr:dicarboxylate/amino acid:cation symporter [Flavobacteriales bacterium]
MTINGKRLPLHTRIIIALFLGVGWALLSSRLGWSAFTIDWIAPFGDIFINLLKLIAVPLVLFSIISGVAGMSDVTKLGKLGVRTLLIYLATTMTAILVGLALVNLIRPGEMADDEQRLRNRIDYELWVASEGSVERPIDGVCMSCDPANTELVQAVREARGSEEGEWVSEKIDQASRTKEQGPLQFLVDMVPSNIFLSFNNTLMLQVIFFAIFFGITLLLIPGEKAGPVVGFMNGCNEVFMKMVDLVMEAAPFFVFALMAGVVARMSGDDPGAAIELFKGLSAYGLVVLLGLALILFVIYPIALSLVLRRNVYGRFFKSMGPAQLLAFSTSSSAATLPVTMECVEENIGVSRSTASFVLPIGATVNMDGTSLYQAIAVIFLAQFHMVDLAFADQMTIVLTATLASIGAAAVPSAGLIMLIVVLTSLGLDPAWIGIIYAIDRPLDMCRTVINVSGDATVSSIVAHSQGERLFTGERS